ncbi:unnamed protein product [Trichobilharzia regenti]|nr:unnamed protein product [Trichobilharzia regenti]
MNTETSALILSSLKSQEKEIRDNIDAQGNAVIHSDGDAILYRNRPQTDPSQRIHLSNNLVSAESARSVAVAIPLSGQLNYIGSGGPYQIIPENLQTIKQRRSGSAVGQVFVAGINPHTAHFLSAMGTASSGTYTMNSSVSAGTPTGSGSPTGSPHMEDKPTNVITSSEHPAHLVWPNKLNVRPLSVSNLALQRPASAPQSGWRASLPRHVMPNTSNILIGQPNVTPSGPMNVTLIGTDSYPSMHASLLLTSKPQYGQNHQTNQTQVNNLQGVTTTNMIMASNPILSSSINPVRAICMPIQHQSVQLAQITSDGNKAVHSQIKLPPGCAILTGSGQTSNIGGRIIYVDRATGQIFSQPGQQHTAQTTSVQSNTSSVPPDVTRNARSLGRRLGPPPPAPERKDSVLQKTSEIKTQKSLTQSSSLSTPLQSEKSIKSLVRDQSDSQGEETSDSPHHSQNLNEKVHPLAVGMITGHNGLHSVSCLSLAARGRSTLSLANICVNDRDASDFDKASDDEQTELHSIHQYPCINSLHRSRILASVSARASDADVTDDDHHSVCSQRSSTARSVSAVCRHGHKQHHHHHHHHHYNRQNRARCLSAIDPYLMSNHNVNDADDQNAADKGTDVCKTEIPTNLRGTTTKSHSFRRLVS